MKAGMIIGGCVAVMLWSSLEECAMSAEVGFKVVGQEPKAKEYLSCRRMIVGPGVNQPTAYQGYGGYVSGEGITRLRSGRWVLTFMSGVWHVTVPWTDDIRKDPACRRQFEKWQKIGLPDYVAPRGGRTHIMFSDDEGLTWSKPKVLVDTEADDRGPTVLELDDGTLMCTFFTYRLPRIVFAKYMLSHDGARSWTEPMDLPGKPEHTAFANGPAIQLADGTVVWVVEGEFDRTHKRQCIGTFRSTDRGRTFKLASVVKADHELNEPTAAEIAPGKLVMIIRREGDMCFSDDGGVTWQRSGATGWDLYAPHLLRMPNGVLALFHGSYANRGIRVFLSPDGGRTWHGPGKKDGKPYGFSVDPSVYGYCHPMLLPDGTVYLVYRNTGGHRPEHARTGTFWGLRVKIHDDAGGIDILPAPGSPAAKGRSAPARKAPDTKGDDPELGNQF